MKKFIAFLMAAAMLFALCACGQQAAAPSEAPAADNQPAEEIMDDYNWIIATSVGEDTVNGLIISKFKELIEEKSGGHITVDLYQAGAMGGDKEIMSGLTTGSIDFVCVTTSNLNLVCPEAALFDIPYLFDDIAVARKVLPEFLPTFNPYAEACGVHILGFSDLGLRIMTSNKPVYTLADWNGLKVRTMENKFMMQLVELLGGSATPTDFGEVFMALQQGTVDAQSNALELTVSSKFYEAQKYLLMTNHEAHIVNFLMSNDLYASLPDDVRALVDECSSEAVAYGNEKTVERYNERYAILADALEVIEYDEDTINSFKEVLKPEVEAIRSTVGDELVDSLLTMIEAAK